MDDLYKILEIDENADRKTIINAYKVKALKTHPDKPGGSDAKFKQVSIAYRLMKGDS